MKYEKAGTIFGIQKFSIHDGPGIRTVVFLKGCPLRCIWCHNPEGISKEIQLRQKSEEAQKSEVLSEDVKRINQCRELAEKQSLMAKFHDRDFELVGNVVSVEEILKEVMKDQHYYEKSGGGLTVSGGEPTFQPDFLLELLKAAKNAGINTCLETCGYASLTIFRKLAPFVDLFLFDIKETDDELSKELIGVSTKRIFAVLDLLAGLNTRIILRCPIIPTLNDRPEHFAKLAELTQKYDAVEGCEIMPYHNFGVSKAQKIDYPFIEEFETPSKATVNMWQEQIRKEGGTLVEWEQISLY